MHLYPEITTSVAIEHAKDRIFFIRQRRNVDVRVLHVDAPTLIQIWLPHMWVAA
jgi:hypothetical protein